MLEHGLYRAQYTCSICDRVMNQNQLTAVYTVGPNRTRHSVLGHPHCAAVAVAIGRVFYSDSVLQARVDEQRIATMFILCLSAVLLMHHAMRKQRASTKKLTAPEALPMAA